MNRLKTTLAIVGVSFFLLCISACDSESEKDTVAVLITAWGQPSRYVFEYSWNNHYWGRIGDTSESEDQKCKIGHVGEIIEIDGEPYSQLSHLGIMPWGFNHVFPGSEDMYDDGGYYKLEGDVYKSIHPDLPPLNKSEVPDSGVTPTLEVMDVMSALPYFPLDPRTGEDLLEGWFLIEGMPNGECDANELNNMLFMYYYKIMGLPTEPWLAADIDEAHLFFEEKMTATKAQLEAAFGDQIDVRDGYYTAVPGTTRHEVEVAREFAQEGFRNMLVSRETTDNNNYANEFMVLNYVKEELCEQGVLDDTKLYMTRQIGRTPEYNAMNLQHVRPYIEAYPKGSTIAMVYVTHGLSWPGTYSTGHAMSTQHPWWKEVIHENSFLNYLAWKEALLEEFGDDYTLVFSRDDSDQLKDSFYAYGYFNADRLNEAFYTLREAIQLAKSTGTKNLIVVPGHWHGDAQDTQYIMRHLNNLPLVPMADMQAGNYALTFCEDADDNQVDCGGTEVAEITITPSYNDLDDEFATVYATRLRGGIERFGVYPLNEQFGTKVTKKLSKQDGGTVAAVSGEIRGAKIVVPEDPYPDLPEAFSLNSAIPFSETNEPFECMWNDTKIIVAHRTNPPSVEGHTALGPAVHFGPYRIVFNCDVTLTVPYDVASAGDQQVGVSVYNHLTEAWEPVAVESAENGLVTFKTQYLGLFQASRIN